jgi:hypothetical protein
VSIADQQSIASLIIALVLARAIGVIIVPERAAE